MLSTSSTVSFSKSVLRTKSLADMGFKNVAHVNGGFDALKKTGIKIIEKEKK